MIGGIGLATQIVEGKKIPEVGYMLKEQFWGKGYAVEGAIAVRDYSFQNLGKKELISIVYPANIRSVQVAGKIGMHLSREIDFNGRNHMMYSISSE